MNDDIYNVKVLDLNGKEIGRVVNFSVFSNIDVNKHVVYLAIKNYLANQRQGTHKSKERSEVKGSTRKLFRQKGTGGARRGDIKSPLLRGGGRIFGPKPRDYNSKINDKEKRLALLSTIKLKLEEKVISVVSSFEIETKKTKNLLEKMKKIEMCEKKNLIIIGDLNENLMLSSRNLQNVTVKSFSMVNAYDIISACKVYFEEEVVGNFFKRLNL